MFLSREIYIKLCQNYTKTLCINEIWYSNLSYKHTIFSKYATSLKTTISHRRLENSGLLLLLFELNDFLFLIDMIDNIIDTSVSRDQNSHQWQCSIIVLRYQPIPPFIIPLQSKVFLLFAFSVLNK